MGQDLGPRVTQTDWTVKTVQDLCVRLICYRPVGQGRRDKTWICESHVTDRLDREDGTRPGCASHLLQTGKTGQDLGVRVTCFRQGGRDKTWVCESCYRQVRQGRRNKAWVCESHVTDRLDREDGTRPWTASHLLQTGWTGKTEQNVREDGTTPGSASHVLQTC